MEDLQCDLVPEEEARSDAYKCRFQNDVLRLRMGLMTKEYEAEKDKIIKATDKTIEELKTTNAELNIEIGDRSDKMHQMGKEIESLTKRASELSMQKIKLEIDLKHATEMYEQSSEKHVQQDERIKKLESELSEVKTNLEAIRIAKEEQESWFATYLKEADEKQEKRDKEADEKQERRDKEADEKQARRDKTLFDMMEKRHTELLSQIKTMDIRPTSPAGKESKLNIVDARSVQITLDSPNGRNNAALSNSLICKPSKGNSNLPK